MTVENTSSKNAIVTGGFAVGATISITFPFEKEDTVMIETEQLGKLVYGSDYEVDENNVVLKKAIATDDKVQVYRKTDLTQERDIPQNAKFNSISLEEALDKLTLQNQEQEEVLDRCLKVETFAEVTPEDMTKAVYDVSMNMPDINATVANIENIKKVAANETDISTVADGITQVETVATDIQSVRTVSANRTDVATVANKISNVNTVAGNMAAVKAVNAGLSTIKAVNENKTNIDNVATKLTEIESVSDNMAAVNTVNTNIENIKAVGNSISNVNSVAGNLTNIGTVANNINTIVGAVSSTAASASEAAASASEAAASASAAASSASTASTAATNASASATEAASSVSSTLTYTSNSKIWAEGTDAEVQLLGGEHSAKGWAQTVDASNFADIDLSNLSLTGQAVMKAKQDVANMTQAISDGNGRTTYPSTGAVRTALDEKQDVSYLTQTVDYATASVSDDRYPSVRAVETALRKRQKISNLTSSVTTDTETYPSNKAVSDALALKQDVANLSQTLDTDTTKYPSNNVVNSAVQNLSTTKQDVANLSQTLDESETKYPSNKAVKTAIDQKDSFPPQTTDDAGKFLQTNGSEVNWETVRQVPSSGSTTWGKYLKSAGDDTYKWDNLDVRQVPYIEASDIKSGTTILQAYKSGDNLLYGWKTGYTIPNKDEFDLPDRAIVFGRTYMAGRDIWFDSDSPLDYTSSIAGYSWEAMAPAMPIGMLFSMICDENWVPPYCVKADGSTYSGNAFKWLYGRRDKVINTTATASYPGAVKYLPTSSSETYYEYYNPTPGYSFWTLGRPKVGGDVYSIQYPNTSSQIISKYEDLSIKSIGTTPDDWYSEEDRQYYQIKLKAGPNFDDPYGAHPEVYSYQLRTKGGNTKPLDPVTVNKQSISQGILSTCTAEQYAKDLTAHGKCYKFVSDAAPDEVTTTVSANFRVPTIPDEIVTTDASDSKQNGILRWFVVLGSMVSDDFSKEWNDSISSKIPSTGDTTNNTEGA